MPQMSLRGFQQKREDDWGKTAIHLPGLQPTICIGQPANMDGQPPALPCLRKKDACLQDRQGFYTISMFELSNVSGLCQGSAGKRFAKTHQRLQPRMISGSYDIKAFIKTIERKDLSEIISSADLEATAAWRCAYRRCKCGETSNELSDRYEYALEELIAFLRAAGIYRPFKIEKDVFDQFLQLRQNLMP